MASPNYNQEGSNDYSNKPIERVYIIDVGISYSCILKTEDNIIDVKKTYNLRLGGLNDRLILSRVCGTISKTMIVLRYSICKKGVDRFDVGKDQ